jgi:hypothetical protein
MAYEDRRQAQPASSTSVTGGRRVGVYLGAALALAVIGGGAAYFALSDRPVEGSLADSPVEDARPVGAGSNPDGVADELQEGLGNETTREDFIEPGAPTEGFPNPLLDAPDVDAPTVPSIDRLDPGPAVDDEVPERMAPDAGTGDADAAPGGADAEEL